MKNLSYIQSLQLDEQYRCEIDMLINDCEKGIGKNRRLCS